MLANSDIALVTGTWSWVEVAGALVRAARAGRGDEPGLLALLDADLGEDGPVTVVGATQRDVEADALRLVRRHAIPAMNAWHLATAVLTLPGWPRRARRRASPAGTRRRRPWPRCGAAAAVTPGLTERAD